MEEVEGSEGLQSKKRISAVAEREVNNEVTNRFSGRRKSEMCGKLWKAGCESLVVGFCGVLVGVTNTK